MTQTTEAPPSGPPVPKTFWEYIRSFGPGIIIVLTWLGAGDIVDMGVAGSNYGYALMWMLVVVLVMRFLFVSLIARYQLCNQHGEGVLDGLARLNPLYAPFILGMVFLLGHFYCAYLTLGTSEVLQHLTGRGTVLQWAILVSASALVLAFQPFYRVLEWVFLFVLLVLSVSFIGTALWVGFDPIALAQGMFRMEMPGDHGKFSPLLVGIAMIGAVGGSLMNLAYPYFLDAKGWKGPQYRKVQFYDFLLGIIAMIVLNLAVWILGAQLLYPNKPISTIHDLPELLVPVLGNKGRVLLYVGIFAACYTSIIGKAVGLGYMGAHAWLRWQAGTKPIANTNYRKHRLYPIIAVWCVVTPLIWPYLGKSDFVALTLAVNSAQVIFLPLLAGGLWWITADSRYIGRAYRNSWWENALMAVLFCLAIWGAVGSVQSLMQYVNPSAPTTAPVAATKNFYVYFGSHRSGPGIGFSLARFDTETGVLTKPEFLLDAAAPAFFVIHPDGKHLYTSNSIDTFEGKPEGTISAYEIDPKTGGLKFLNHKLAGGADPSFISLDRTGKFALDANYRGGNICVYAIAPDGSFGERTAFVQHSGNSVHPQRQTKPYAHAIITDPSNRFALVPDLGVDKVLIYRFDEKTGSLAPNDPPHAAVAPGSGPRHVRFHPNGKWIYVINEIASTVAVFSWDAQKGAMTEIQTLSSLPADFTGTSTASEIEVHPNGKFLYATNRGHDSLAVFAVDQSTGKLSPVQHIPSAGKTPRNFAFDPTAKWIICTNHGSDNAVVFRVDESTGKLTQQGEPIAVPYPFCQRFLPIL